MERRAEGRCTVSCTCLLGSKRKHWSKALSRHISNLYTSCWWNGPQDKQHNWPDFDLSGGAFTSGVLGVLSCKLILQQEQNILCKYKQRGQIGAKLVEDLFQRWWALEGVSRRNRNCLGKRNMEVQNTWVLQSNKLLRGKHSLHPNTCWT